MPYVEVSAKLGCGVEEAFEVIIAEAIVEQDKIHIRPAHDLALAEIPRPTNGKRRCCVF